MNSSTSNSKTCSKHLKKYIVGACVFLLAIFLFDRGLYFLLTTLENNFYPRTQFEKQFEQYIKEKKYSTLILGTSRAYEGIHPFFIEKRLNQKAFKDSCQGKGPKYNYYFYKTYKKYAGIPRVVIYGVDYFVYTITSDPKWMSRFEIAEEEKGIDYFAGPLLLLKNKKKIDTFLNNATIRLMGRTEAVEGIQEFIAFQEYRGIDMEKKDLVLDPAVKFKRQSFPTFPGIEGEYFEKLLNELNQDGAIVLLVILPDYIGTVKTNYQQYLFIDHLKEFEKKYKKVHVLDFSRPGAFPTKIAEYFNDGGYGRTNSHLSKKGAQLFNKILAKSLKKFYE
ncbi:MAG: hypothetical protein MUF15_13395 [Acidobacteria bacterium]|jgi:hypothetical protein|nr:hypothetical protein [Acidobacteriota bacterium]